MFKNTSRFRFAKAVDAKNVFADVNASDPSDTSTSLAASGLHVAVPYGDGINKGVIYPFPLEFDSYKRTNQPSVIHAHGDTVTDLKFSPHNDSLLCTASKDETVKIFEIPDEGLSENLSNSKVSVSGFSGGVNSISFHHAAENILAVGSKQALSLCDVGEGKTAAQLDIAGFGKDIISVDWRYSGEDVVAIGKNSTLHFYDPRGNDHSSLAVHRAQRVLHLGSEGHFLVIGLNKMRTPLLQLWDHKKRDKPILESNLPFSSGVLLPLYDIDTQLLFVTVRGSCQMAGYDLSRRDALVETSKFVGKNPYFGGCLIPKYACDTYESEIGRILRLSKQSVDIVNVSVTRKSKGFHSELYPATASNEPNLTAQEYLEGKNAFPKMVRIESHDFQKRKKDERQQSIEAKKTAVKAAAVAIKQEEKKAPEPEPAQQVFVPSDNRRRLESLMEKSMFQHTRLTEETEARNTYFDIKPDKTKNVALSKFVKCNDKFLAVPCATISASAVLVRRLDQKGRVGNANMVRAHKSQVHAFDLSQFDENLLASGAGDAHAMVFNLPDDGKLDDDIRSPDIDFQCTGKVTVCEFHPQAREVLVTGSVGFSGGTLQMWDLEKQQARISISCFGESALVDTSYCPDSTLMATTSKDMFCRILDPRANEPVVQEFQSETESFRDMQVIYADAKKLLTLGFGKGSSRNISLWDINNTSKPLQTLMIDKTSAQPIPFYDEDTHLLFVASHGSRIIRMFQCFDKIELINTHTSQNDISGMTFGRKALCNVKKAEILKGLCLHANRVMPMSFTVPRKRLEFFQDDLFPDTRVIEPLYSADAFFSGEVAQTRYESLRPQGMDLLSEAPEEKLTERQLRYKNHLAEQAKEAPKGALGTSKDAMAHFEKLAEKTVHTNRWDAEQESGDEIDEDEWSD